uniref:Mitochondrial dicarboxylate carrier n=1 Tax=Timema douglasi TaxID=61478 RepID=A0A7R8VQC7_TIMDO|nr:unnamed protein product [Timema douglasi]
MRRGWQIKCVHLQTQQEGKLSLLRLTVNIVKQQGVLALYNGLSASLLRQLTYSTTRFGIYEVVKQAVAPSGGDISFMVRVGIASVAGAAGGFVGTPGDMINVRMQNDIKLPPESRRNYKHALDGLIRVYQEEGARRLFAGASTATSRAVLMTVGQLSFYDQVKMTLLAHGFSDNLTTHFLSSLTAGAVATTLTQPLDVLKTRAMNAKPGEFKSIWHIITYTAKLGPLGFFKVVISSILWVFLSGGLTASCGRTNLDHPGSTILIECRLSTKIGIATSIVAADTLLSASTVLPNLADNSVPSPSQDRYIDNRWKQVKPSSPLIIENQKVVRPQPRFLVMSRVEDNKNLKRGAKLPPRLFPPPVPPRSPPWGPKLRAAFAEPLIFASEIPQVGISGGTSEAAKASPIDALRKNQRGTAEEIIVKKA